MFYKKATGKPTVSYDHAVEEALCFGWIDGTEKEDGRRVLRVPIYAQKAEEPRGQSRICSVWSG